MFAAVEGEDALWPSKDVITSEFKRGRTVVSNKVALKSQPRWFCFTKSGFKKVEHDNRAAMVHLGFK